MPSSLDDNILAALHDHLLELPNCQKLETLPKPLEAEFAHCWRVSVAISSATYHLLILIDENFPFSLPRVAVENGPPILSWPHLEPDGVLCALPSASTGDWTSPNQLVDYVVKEAYLLIQRNLDEEKKTEIESEFRNEFLSYWHHACDSNATRCVSLVEPRGPSRMVYVFQARRKHYFAETEAQLTTWLENLKIVPPDKPIKATRACLVWLDDAWVPEEYPNSAADINALLQDHAHKLPIAEITECAADGLNVLVGMQTSNGACFAGFKHRPAAPVRQGPYRNSGDPVVKGFRPGRVPQVLVHQRTMGLSAKMNKLIIRRADHGWIHGRDQNEAALPLSQKNVTIVGVGSLGSEIAQLLAKSGVGSLTLIDGETLEWANISRHALGANYEGRKKASSMKDYLSLAYPHVEVEAICENVTPSNSAVNDVLFESDLVMMLTGDWSSTACVNSMWLDANKPTPLMLAWLEAHALATHSVHFSTSTNKPCIVCGFDTVGNPKLPVMHFPQSPVLQQPACGGSFVPYGAVALSKAAGTVTEHAISVLLDEPRRDSHTVAICSNQERINVGAEWADEWVRSEGDPGDGETVVHRTWPKDASCPNCGASTE